MKLILKVSIFLLFSSASFIAQIDDCITEETQGYNMLLIGNSFFGPYSATDDPTLSTTNLNESYDVSSMVYFWGSNIKLDVFEMVYDLNRYDGNDPELFMAHGTAEDPVTPYEEALELKGIYDSLGIYNELATLLLPNGDPAGHGAWNAVVDGKDLYDLSFDFLVERQELILDVGCVQTSTDKINLKFPMKIYPNPASDVINIEVDGDMNFDVKIYDLSGKLIQSSRNVNLIRINTSLVGTFLIQVQDLDSGHRTVQKIVLVR